MYRGWHGVTDRKNVLRACTYCPVTEDTGFLAILFRGGQTVCHADVPLRKYEALIKVPYGLNYYHKQIKMQYPRVGDPPPPPPFEEDRAVIEQKSARLRAEEAQMLAQLNPIALDLFGEAIRGLPVKRANGRLKS